MKGVHYEEVSSFGGSRKMENMTWKLKIVGAIWKNKNTQISQALLAFNFIDPKPFLEVLLDFFSFSFLKGGNPFYHQFHY